MASLKREIFGDHHDNSFAINHHILKAIEKEAEQERANDTSMQVTSNVRKIDPLLFVSDYYSVLR